MRLRKLGPAVVAATSLLALAPAAASAHKHPSPLGRCSININVAERQITAGEQVQVTGQLKYIPPATAGSQAVTLYEHVAGTAGYIPIQSATTDSSGFYEFKPPALNANTFFYVRSHRAQSGHEKARVALQVTLIGPPEGTQITTGAPNQQTFSGTVSPADVGARVILQRQNAVTGNEWHRIGIGQVVAGGPTGGTYTITHTFRVPGDASIRVLVRSDRINSPSESNMLEYEISQAQNPSLTISSSTDPISYEQPVTISGVLAGATTPQTVTLEARTIHQHGFAPVAEVSTGTSGAYSFPAQVPVNSTFYRVKGAGQKSAVLFEGVKDVLTAEISPTTVQAGEALTFKGTVKPDHTGHIVYLERQNAAGTGFHVVQVGHILPGSAYSIVHQVYVPGTKVYRVDVPGGPDNGRAVSQLFTVQVTQAPPSALTPEAPNNSSQPGEGQTTGSGAETPLSE
jgi:hypothetical protein